MCVCANGFGKSKARLVNGAAIEWQDRTGQARTKAKPSLDGEGGRFSVRDRTTDRDPT